MFQEFVFFYTEINSLTSVYSVLQTVTHFCQLFLEAFLETIFLYICQCSLCFNSDFLSAHESFYFQNTFSQGNMKSRAVSSPGNMANAPKSTHRAWQEPFVFFLFSS